MIKLVKISNYKYAVLTNSPDSTGKGTLKQAAATLERLGVPKAEVLRAAEDMVIKGTNVADFGLARKTFQFSQFIDLSDRGLA